MQWRQNSTILSIFALAMLAIQTSANAKPEPRPTMTSTVFASGCFGNENIRAAFPAILSVCPIQPSSTPQEKRSSSLGGLRISMQYCGNPKKDAALPTRVHWQGVRSWLGEFRGYPSIEYEADGPNVTNRLRGRTVLANGYLIEVVGQYQRPEDRSMVDAFINSLSIGKAQKAVPQ